MERLFQGLQFVTLRYFFRCHGPFLQRALKELGLGKMGRVATLSCSSPELTTSLPAYLGHWLSVTELKKHLFHNKSSVENVKQIRHIFKPCEFRKKRQVQMINTVYPAVFLKSTYTCSPKQVHTSQGSNS